MSQSCDDILDNDESDEVVLRYTADESDVGIRLDKLASTVFDEFSRSTLQKWIESGQLTVNDDKVKNKYVVKAGDVVSLTATLEAHSDDLPENIPLDIVYEDDDLVIINKPVGMVVHPGAGNRTGTLVNALLYHYPAQSHLPRAGLVHRIDKDTSGLLVVAKTAAAQLDLITQLKDKHVYREYVCVVKGEVHELAKHSRIDEPIARHPTARTKMAVRQNGKPAVTHLKSISPLTEGYAVLQVLLETGRTHQIRVHLAFVGHALVGDKVYGASNKAPKDPIKARAVANFARQALHAHTLGLVHPTTKQKLQVSCPLPSDMQTLIDVLKE